MEPSPELRECQLALYRAMSSGNAGSVEAFYSLAPESVFIGTDAVEFWIDSSQHNDDVRPFFDGSHGLIKWEPGDAISLSEGGIGWTIDRPAVTFADGARLQLRITLVWRREPDAWRIVHSHASVGG